LRILSKGHFVTSNSIEEVQAKFAPVVSPGQGSFDQRMLGATIIDSAALEQDKLALVGVPMIVTRVTYRPKTSLQERGYVSVEAVLGSEKFIRNAISRNWMPGVTDLSQFRYAPDEKIVFNDGGTGIRRQLTMILHAQERLNVGEIVDDATFDIDWTEWQSFDTSTKQKVGDQEIQVPDFRDVRVAATRGLRVSNYTIEGQQSTTFYLA